MAAYESAPLVEDAPGGDAALKQKAKPWRKLGLAMAAAATIAVAIGAMTFRSRKMTPIERMHRLHSGLMRAFSTRALQEAADLTATLGFTWAEEGQEDPDAMGIVADISESTEEHDHLQISITFAAQEGKGADLAAQFQKVIDGIKELTDASESSDEDVVSVMQVDDEDEVVITVTPPEPEEAEKDMEEAMQVKPSFHAELHFGRDIDEMFENIDENIATLPRGIKGEVSAAVAHTLFMALAEMEGSGPADPLMMMSGMSKFETTQEFRYRAGTDAFDQLPTLEDAAGMAANILSTGPESIIHPMHGLADLSDGVKSITISGLPNNFEVVMTFTNVHITPLLKKLIGDIDAADGEFDPVD